jgi:hypothetical protein
MRFILAIFAVWIAIVIFPDQPRVAAGEPVKEKVWMSRACPDSRWYLESSDEQSATLVCYEASAGMDGF